MAARGGGKALALAMLICFLLVQGTLGEFQRCYCDVYRVCKQKNLFRGDYCKVKAHNDCKADFDRMCPKDHGMGAAFAHQINDDSGMTVPAGGADHGKLNVSETSVVVPAGAGGADHGEFIIAKEDAAP